MERGLRSDVNEQIKALMNTDIAAAVNEIRQHLERPDDVQLNVAITGQTGTGKSSFVNYFRGIEDSDEEAAPSGFVETTKELKSFPHPNHPNVTLWDLPGIGSTEYPADHYFQKFQFEKFDFFIIISADRFRENDVKLAKEIQRMGKKFYFVRSKIDQNLCGEKKSQNFNEEVILKDIKENCIKGLKTEGIEDPQVFLLSNFDLHHEDPLIETFKRDLPELKKHALLMFMLNIFLEVINKKKEAFQAESKYYGGISAFGAAVLGPGLSVAVDLTLLKTVVPRYVSGFGLDESSLERLATSTGVPFDDPGFNIKSILARKGIITNFILKLLIQLANTAELKAAGEKFIHSSMFNISRFWYRFAGSWFPFPETDERFSFIQTLRIALAPVLSFTTTYRALNAFIDQLAEEAQRVFKRALGLDITV